MEQRHKARDVDEGGGTGAGTTTAAPTATPSPVTRKLTAEELAHGGFTSKIPYDDTPADCVVICCSDPPFERQTEDLMSALGYEQPHYIQVPSGPALFGALVAAKGFLTKSMGTLLSKAIELTGVDTIILVGHEGCGGYRLGKIRLVQETTRRFVGKSVREIQCDHLANSGKAIHRSLNGEVTVQAFYADVIDGPGGGQQVNFRLEGTWEARATGRTVDRSQRT